MLRCTDNSNHNKTYQQTIAFFVFTPFHCELSSYHPHLMTQFSYNFALHKLQIVRLSPPYHHFPRLSHVTKGKLMTENVNHLCALHSTFIIFRLISPIDVLTTNTCVRYFRDFSCISFFNNVITNTVHHINKTNVAYKFLLFTSIISLPTHDTPSLNLM